MGRKAPEPALPARANEQARLRLCAMGNQKLSPGTRRDRNPRPHPTHTVWGEPTPYSGW